LGFGGSLGSTAPKRAEDTFATDIYQYAKFHADRCHRRRDICNQTQQKSASARRISTNAGVQLELCATPCPLFKGNISVAGCMSLSSLLKTIKINGGVECRCEWTRT